MEENIYQFAEKISKLFQRAYDAYLPLVEDVCGKEYQKMKVIVWQKLPKSNKV